MKHVAVVALVLAAGAVSAQEASEEQMARIDETLAAMRCEVDPAEVDVDEGVFDLDDVICADGQYDIKLDANYAVIEQRKE
jgi:hypothetical protein